MLAGVNGVKVTQNADGTWHITQSPQAATRPTVLGPKLPTGISSLLIAVLLGVAAFVAVLLITENAFQYF